MEDPMFEIESCQSILVNYFERILTFATSWHGQLVFMSAATVRAIFYYLLRNPMREARELAYVLAATGAFSLWIALSENYSPISLARIVTACVEPGSKIARDGEARLRGEAGDAAWRSQHASRQ
jgi:hypothetical protein